MLYSNNIVNYKAIPETGMIIEFFFAVIRRRNEAYEN